MRSSRHIFEASSVFSYFPDATRFSSRKNRLAAARTGARTNTGSAHLGGKAHGQNAGKQGAHFSPSAGYSATNFRKAATSWGVSFFLAVNAARNEGKSPPKLESTYSRLWLE